MPNLLSDDLIPFIRRSGRSGVGRFSDIAGDAGSDPVAAFDMRHPSLRMASYIFGVSVLQTAMCPASAAEWERLFWEPPSRAELDAALSRVSGFFDLGGSAPFMQTPSVGESPRGTKPSASDEADDAEDGEDEDGGAAPGSDISISVLLPDEPTGTSVMNGTAFLTKDKRVTKLGPFAAGMSLFGACVLFPQEGGGYFALPHGCMSPKVLLVPVVSDGATLWQKLWLNVLDPAVWPRLKGPVWKPGDEARTFGWMHPALKDAPGERMNGKKSEAAKSGGKPTSAVDVDTRTMHALSVLWPMARRHLLAAPAPDPGRCDLTDIAGDVYYGMKRWPHGLRYGKKGWEYPYCPRLVEYEGVMGEEGAAWKLKDTRVLPARRPLRMQDWPGFLPSSASPLPRMKPDPEKPSAVVAEVPAVVSAFAGRASVLSGEGDRGAAGLGGASASLWVATMFAEKKTLNGWSERTLRLHAAGPEALYSTGEFIAWACGMASRIGAKTGEAVDAVMGARRSGESASQMKAITADRFLSVAESLEGEVMQDAVMLGGVPSSGRASATDEARVRWTKRYGDAALALFDAECPIRAADSTSVAACRSRVKLAKELRSLWVPRRKKEKPE